MSSGNWRFFKISGSSAKCVPESPNLNPIIAVNDGGISRSAGPVPVDGTIGSYVPVWEDKKPDAPKK
jgi:hypothetical protein